jgi:transketolase
MLRAIPNINIFSPCDPLEVKACLREALRINQPTYIRIGKKGEPNFHSSIPNFSKGKSITLKQGTDVCLLSAGTSMDISYEVSRILESKGFSVEITSCYSIKPIHEGYLSSAFKKFKLVASIEEHSIIGGWGSAIAEWLFSNNIIPSAFMIFGTEDRFLCKTGDQSYARDNLGLNPHNIAASILNRISEMS